jgi:hypothetical protein
VLLSSYTHRVSVTEEQIEKKWMENGKEAEGESHRISESKRH